jgi:phage terminase large subunit-like protein
MFVMIFELDEDDDWRDKANWIKSSPNLGITVEEDWLQSQVNQAIITPSEETGVRTKNLNQWVDSSEVWIPEDYIISSFVDKLPTFDEDDICYIGVDLASTSDLTAVSFLIEKEGIYYY